MHLEYLETATGKILYFRPGRDVHLQRYPGELSVSLNLIGECSEIGNIPQFELDAGAATLVGLLAESSVSRQLLPFELVSLVGANEEVLGLVEQLALRHPAEHVRGAAYRSLAARKPEEDERLLRPGRDGQLAR